METEDAELTKDSLKQEAKENTNEFLSERYCSGIMGVPITFFDNYNSNQFEILGLTNGRKEFNRESWPVKRYLNAIQHNKDKSTTNGSKANTRATIISKNPKGLYYTADNTSGKLEIVYARILIRRKL